MASHWIILLLIGCAIATPFRQPLNDEEARQLRRRELLDDPNTNAFARIEAINEEEDVEPSMHEGDIKLTEADKKIIDTSTDGDVDGDSGTASKRSTTHRGINNIWRERTIYYTIQSPELDSARPVILQGIHQFHQHTCIKWVERKNNEPYYVKFEKLSGCWSYIGFSNDLRKFQEISIGGGCESVGIILHEMLHCVGMWHEQSRPDRNSVVEILWENIIAGKEHNFNKNKANSVDSQDTPYDIDSIMQYPRYSFSKNGKPTINYIADPNKKYGFTNDFSPNDIIAINKLYSCSVINGGWGLWTSYSPCDANCKKSKYRFCTNVDKAACDPTKPDGKDVETVVCPDAECHAPVAGHWGRWSAWGSCSKTCDDGTKTRTRVCDDPAPKYGGAACPGSSSMTGVCKLKDCGAGPGDCGFDDDAEGFCDWTQDVSDKPTYKSWMRGSSTPSSGTGPQSGDHSSGSGKFLYGEASDCLNNKGKYVRLQSVEFAATGAAGRCMRVWYLANGVMVGELNVHVKDSGNGVLTKLPGSIIGDQGQAWKEAKFHISHSAKYRIVLEMVCGLDYRGDVAIDDIKFTDGAC